SQGFCQELPAQSADHLDHQVENERRQPKCETEIGGCLANLFPIRPPGQPANECHAHQDSYFLFHVFSFRWGPGFSRHSRRSNRLKAGLQRSLTITCRSRPLARFPAAPIPSDKTILVAHPPCPPTGDIARERGRRG